MNLINCFVTKVLSKPALGRYEKYEVKVEFNSYGSISTTVLYFDTLDEAESVNIGYEFLN